MRARFTPKAAPKIVDYASNKWDHDCVLYGSMGFSTSFIMEKTGLSFCQVSYRLQKARVKRSDYRNGNGAIVRAILRNAQDAADNQLRIHLKRVLG